MSKREFEEGNQTWARTLCRTAASKRMVQKWSCSSVRGEEMIEIEKVELVSEKVAKGAKDGGGTTLSSRWRERVESDPEAGLDSNTMPPLPLLLSWAGEEKEEERTLAPPRLRR